MTNNTLKAFAALALVGSTSVLTLAAAPAHAQTLTPWDIHRMQLEQMALEQTHLMERQRFIAEQEGLLRRYNEKQYHQDRNHSLVGNMMTSFFGGGF